VLSEADTQSELDLPAGSRAVSSHVTGTIWKMLVEEGQRVATGSTVLVVESMKMEIAVETPVGGIVRQVFCKQGGHVMAGQMLLVIEED
jgi:urea carboxylase